MATETEFGLIKPSPDDFYDVEVQNTNMDTIDSLLDDIHSTIGDTNGVINNHKNASNPHNITPSKIGLNNVDNTSDITKPVSTAQAAAIAKAKEEANATAMNYVQNSMSGHRNEDIHVTSAERAKWNTAADIANNVSELAENGGFEHLMDYEVNLPLSSDDYRDIVIPITPDISNYTAIKVVTKGKIFGEVTSASTTNSQVTLHYGTRHGSEDRFFAQMIDESSKGTFQTKEFTTSQEFLITKRYFSSDAAVKTQEIGIPPVKVTYASPCGFNDSYNIRADEDSTDFSITLGNHIKGTAGFAGTIKIYVR